MVALKDFMLLLILFIFIFIVLGTQLFGGNSYYTPANTATWRKGFASFYESFYTVSILLRCMSVIVTTLALTLSAAMLSYQTSCCLYTADWTRECCLWQMVLCCWLLTCVFAWGTGHFMLLASLHLDGTDLCCCG